MPFQTLVPQVYPESTGSTWRTLTELTSAQGTRFGRLFQFEKNAHLFKQGKAITEDVVKKGSSASTTAVERATHATSTSIDTN